MQSKSELLQTRDGKRVRVRAPKGSIQHVETSQKFSVLYHRASPEGGNEVLAQFVLECCQSILYVSGRELAQILLLGASDACMHIHEIIW